MTRSADAALLPDASFVPTSHRGLTYPFGPVGPASQQVMAVADGLRWVRLAVPGPLKHINCWLIDDADARGPGVALVDTGMNLDATRDD